MRVTIEAVAKDLKKTSKNTSYTSLKLTDGSWINISGDHRALRGSINITEPKTFGSQLWVQIEKPPPSDETKPGQPETKTPKSEPETHRINEGRPKTIKETFTMIEVLHAKSKTLEPASPEARAILTSAMISSWFNGKLVS